MIPHYSVTPADLCVTRHLLGLLYIYSFHVCDALAVTRGRKRMAYLFCFEALEIFPSKIFVCRDMSIIPRAGNCRFKCWRRIVV